MVDDSASFRSERILPRRSTTDMLRQGLQRVATGLTRVRGLCAACL